MKPFKTEKSKALFYDTKKYLVDGVASSFHKAPDEEYPIFIAYGKGGVQCLLAVFLFYIKACHKIFHPGIVVSF